VVYKIRLGNIFIIFALLDNSGLFEILYKRHNSVAYCLQSHTVKLAKECLILAKSEVKVMADIVDTAIAAGSFKTLVTAVKAAGLVDTLKSKGPFTVFAPNDDAFAKLPEGTVESLLKDVPKLKAVLTYHVVAGKVKAADVTNMRNAKTIQGQDIQIDASSKGVRINDAQVINADIIADNGVIHVIDKVLMPTIELAH
jgi:uncharacterized surface protein with fasciclin (FAS1) repeats